MIADLWAHRDLLWLLTVREIRIRYARAALGIAWALFIPLVQMVVFTVLGLDRLIGSEDAFSEMPYPVFAYLGLLPWTHFATSMSQGTPALVNAANMLKKSAFPREVIPLAKMFAAGFDLLIGSTFVVILLFGYGLPLHATALIVPGIFLLQLAFTAGIVLLFSAGNMFFRDVNYLVNVGLLLAMFATSVIYPVRFTKPAWVAEILMLNPMTSYLDAYREALLLGQWPTTTLVPGIVGAIGMFVVGSLAFRALAPRFAEEI